MSLKTGLVQQQTVKLTMTQELTQAIALLQYSAQELTTFLENKALENPLIQIESNHSHAGDLLRERPKKRKKPDQKDNKAWIEQIGGEKKTMEEYIFSQLNPACLNEECKKVFRHLILNLDESGYLRADIGEVANQLGTDASVVEKYLHMLQELEPAGIGARSLNECLLLQLKRFPERHELAEFIISEYFTLFAEKKWPELAKALGIKLSQIQEVFDLVQTLNPRPALAFREERPVYILPDVVIKWDGEDLTVAVCNETIPKISFNREYFRYFSALNDRQVNRFLKEKQQDYYWLVRSLEQRKETLLKVTGKIVEKQEDFFRRGPSYLKPMTMKEVSDELGIHESTVSRAVREKYAETPYGTFELRSFFTSTLNTVSDDAVSAQQVKDAIADLIAGESKQKPLSDQQIARLLKERQGYIVSRRTVAKYRSQMGIPSSTKRKRYD